MKSLLSSACSHGHPRFDSHSLCGLRPPASPLSPLSTLVLCVLGTHPSQTFLALLKPFLRSLVRCILRTAPGFVRILALLHCPFAITPPPGCLPIAFKQLACSPSCIFMHHSVFSAALVSAKSCFRY
uniref:Uncharacterized protein n=1 Tax=Myotis myotis TaxID=51298 RepID=A0A7J7Z5S6_MYOMY|nr:hypothetical protein mMyoMyo1_010731 [Myotis myotis]